MPSKTEWLPEWAFKPETYGLHAVLPLDQPSAFLSPAAFLSKPPLTTICSQPSAGGVKVAVDVAGPGYAAGVPVGVGVSVGVGVGVFVGVDVGVEVKVGEGVEGGGYPLPVSAWVGEGKLGVPVACADGLSAGSKLRLPD